MSRVKERLSREQETHAQSQREVYEESELRLIVNHFETFAEQISGGLAKADFPLQRRLLQLLIKRVEVDADEVRIVYKVQIRPFASSPERGDFLHDCLKRPASPSGKKRKEAIA